MHGVDFTSLENAVKILVARQSRRAFSVGPSRAASTFSATLNKFCKLKKNFDEIKKSSTRTDSRTTSVTAVVGVANVEKFARWAVGWR